MLTHRCCCVGVTVRKAERYEQCPDMEEPVQCQEGLALGRRYCVERHRGVTPAVSR